MIALVAILYSSTGNDFVVPAGNAWLHNPDTCGCCQLHAELDGV